VAERYEFIERTISLVLKPDILVLDIGCGKSVYKPIFVQQQYFGIDPFIENEPGVTQASAINMPFRDSTFDLAFGVASLHLIGPECFKEVFRVLKPGGQFLIFDYNKKVLERLKSVTGMEHATWSPRELRNELNRAGLVKIKRLTHRSKIRSYYLQPISALKLRLRGSWVIFTCEKPLQPIDSNIQ
jgi:SAM-dependent methyltransferase